MTTLSMRGTAMATDAIRAYLTTLREVRRISQQRVADEIGVTRVSWQKYENGTTRDPQSSFLLGALRFLGGSFDDLRELSGAAATEEQGKAMAALRAARLEAAAAEEALRETLSAAEWDAYVAELEQRARDLAERARREEERINRLRGGGA